MHGGHGWNGIAVWGRITAILVTIYLSNVPVSREPQTGGTIDDPGYATRSTNIQSVAKSEGWDLSEGVNKDGMDANFMRAHG